VRDAYFKLVEGLTQRVAMFGQNGRDALLEMARSPGLEDEQRMLLMIDYRSMERIPTKEPVALDEEGRVVCGYQRRQIFRGEQALLEAAGLA
jgi:hypothetical protein